MLDLFKVIWEYDESSPEFRSELAKRNLELEIVTIKPHSSQTDISVVRKKKFSTVIDKRIFESLEKELNRNGILEAINDIASIVKQYYSRKVLYEINKTSIENFNTEFRELNKLIDKELSSIKLNGKYRKDKSVTIKNPHLIKLILHSYIRQLHNNPTAYNLIAANNLNQYKASTIITNLESEAAYELFLYIQTKTKFKYKSSALEIKKGILKNRFCELIHEILLIGNIITEAQTDAPASFIRNRLNRFMTHEPTRIELLNDKLHPVSFPSLFPDAVFVQEMINVKNKLALQLKQNHLDF